MSDKIISVRMLGEFTVCYGGEVVQIDRNGSSKMTQLLQMVLLGGADGFNKKEMTANIYQPGEVDSDNRSLNILLFRLRKRMEAIAGEGKVCVDANRSLVWWNNDVPLETDVEQFRLLSAKAADCIDTEEKISLLKEACSFYRGEFLPMLDENWRLAKASELKSLYYRNIHTLCNYLTETERWEELFEVAGAAAAVYPMDEWQTVQIDARMAQERYTEARALYEATSHLYMEELGINPTPALRERIDKLQEGLNRPGRSLEDVRKDLGAREGEKGGYFCSYPGFLDVFHCIDALMHRMNKSWYLLCCTIANKDGEPFSNPDRLDRYSASVKKGIGSSIRHSDAYTSIGPDRYLILLAASTRKNCGVITSRIRKSAVACGLPGDKYLHFEELACSADVT